MITEVVSPGRGYPLLLARLTLRRPQMWDMWLHPVFWWGTAFTLSPKRKNLKYVISFNQGKRRTLCWRGGMVAALFMSGPRQTFTRREVPGLPICLSEHLK